MTIKIVINIKGENVMNADNQQESLDNSVGHYIAGFVDGEGSFHIAIQKNESTRLKIQVIPEFHVSQNRTKVSILQMIQRVLGCGYIKANHRNHLKDKTDVFVVRNRNDLLQKVIPFFEKYPIRSPKRKEFETFAEVVKRLERKDHLQKEGLTQILKVAFSMHNGVYRKIKLGDILKHLESSETVRQMSAEGG